MIKYYEESENNIPTLHISTEKGWRGGEQQVKLLTDGLAERGNFVKVLSPAGAALMKDRHAKQMGLPLVNLFGEWDPWVSWKITDYVRHYRFKLIHAHTSHAHSIALRAARWINIPLVVSRRVDFPVKDNALSRKKYINGIVHYIAISEAVKNVLVQSGVSEKQIDVVHSGVDPDRFPLKPKERNEELVAQWGGKIGEPLIVNVAALTDHKDQATLLHAAAILKQRGIPFRLLIAGAGELYDDLMTLRNRLNLQDSVELLGYVKDELPYLYQAADVFVMSSHLEGLCTSILDALSIGVPVVATQTGGIPEIIKDGENGLLAPPKNPEKLADAIARLIADGNLQNRFRIAGRKTVETEFTNDTMVEGTLNVYRKLLKK